jgi:aryl-alcohol dehydrogenase-like predicted oxidoreductase
MYNVYDRTAEDVLNACEQQKLAFLPWFPLGGGEDVRHEVLDNIAAAHKATAQQIAIAWLLQRSSVMVPIAGTSSIEHFDENLAAAAIELSPEELKSLDS